MPGPTTAGRHWTRQETRPTWSPVTGEASVTRVEELQAPDVWTIPFRQPNRIPGDVCVGFALLPAASHGNGR